MGPRLTDALPDDVRPSSAGLVVAPSVPDRPIWRNRDFLLLWLAQIISQTAQNAIWFGILILVQRRSNSSTQLSLAILTLIIPSVLFGVLAGVYVDRWDKRTVLIWSNVLRGGIALGYALFGSLGALPLSALYVVNFAFSTVGQFFAPAESAMIPAIVARPRLLQANSLFHLSFTASQLVGLVVLGPLLVKAVGLDVLFSIMAGAIVVCGGLVWPLPGHRGEHDPGVPATGREAIAGVWRDARAVAQFVLGRRVVALVMVQWTIGAILGLVVATLVPGFAERQLQVRAEDAVVVMAPAGIGMVAGTAILNRWGQRLNKHFLTNVGLIVVAACLGAIGAVALVSGWLWAAAPPRVPVPVIGAASIAVPVVMALALLAGFGFVAIMVPAQTFLQEQAPTELRGRVFAVQLMLSNLASILPLVLLGGLADLIGVDRTFVLIGVLVGAASAVGVRVAPGRAPWHGRGGAVRPGGGEASAGA